ncbi:hypothetical protein [Streptomyces albospinus]|uniref:hypothetical protein n=1 Tax=Streptomyces albospinus TaxID=285515 RepID=UPI001670368D|nr:hypothetical protein [Streptomyces albospinus]
MTTPTRNLTPLPQVLEQRREYASAPPQSPRTWTSVIATVPADVDARSCADDGRRSSTAEQPSGVGCSGVGEGPGRGLRRRIVGHLRCRGG